jgi:cholinesterase
MWASSYLTWLAVVSSGVSAALVERAAGSPTVKVKNGTYAGVYSVAHKQDYFLGVPYAQTPVGDLRFRIPQSLNSTWLGERAAANYSAEVKYTVIDD